MKRKKLILLCLSIVLLCVFFCFGVVTAGANEAVLSSVSYQETYNLGDRLDVQSAKFTYKSNEYEAKAVINYPSGKRISSNSVLLTEGGVHTIEYLTTIDGKVCSETYQFTVLDSVYTIDGSGEMEYGSNSYFDGLGDVKGLNVSLGKDSTFKFNSVIDVSNLDRYDTVMKWYSTPKVLGSYDVARVYFRLTDVYNPDNYVEMLFKYSPDNNYASTYIVGYANGQLPSGLHYRSKGASATSYEFNGYHYTLYQNNRHYGYLAELSFSGEVPPYNKDFSENCMRFAIDYQERQLYCTPAWGNNMDKCIVIDLDDSRIFGDNVWGGFTTGEVLASVYAEQYSTSSYNFFVSEIYGHEVGDLFASNSVAPNIVVDTLGYNENDLPDAVVNREYKIFDVQVIDESEGLLDYKTVVYYNYNNSSRSQISVTDGKFVPKRAGEYTIIYSASDSFGNRCEKILTINAVVKENIDYSFSAHQTVFEAGDVVIVAYAFIENAGKNYNVEVQAKHTEKDVVYEIDSQTNSFRPLYSGNYKIEYCYTDYSMVDSFSYEITVNATDTVKFVREPVLPRYLIKNCMYSFDSGEAYSFAPSTSVVPTKIYARTTGTNRTEIQNNKYAVREDVDCIDLIYTAGNMEKIYTVPVVDAGYGEIGRLKIGEYLQGEAFTYQSTRYGTTYTTDEKKATNGKATLSLINPAYLIRDFQIAFTGVTDKNNFDSITITFTSLKNSSDLIRFTFEKQANLKSIVTVSRGNYIVSSNSESTFNSNEQTGFSIVYANGNFSIGGSNLSIPYATLFDGFGDFFYIDIELAGITGESALYVKKLVNQVISSTTYDTIKPTLIYDNFNTSYVLGDTVHFGKISCYDFVDPNASVSLSVLLNYSSPVTANNGVVLDGISNSTECEYDYTWNTYSDLYVKIEAKDYSEQVATDEPVFVLLDAISPTITLGEMQTQCTLNDTVTVATPTVSDDREGVKTSIVVICPNGRTYTVKNQTFIADCWGTYTVMYMATDASGNVEFASYKVICG